MNDIAGWDYGGKARKKRLDESTTVQIDGASTMSLSGHALGAVGKHETMYTILMMNNDFIFILYFCLKRIHDR